MYARKIIAVLLSMVMLLSALPVISSAVGNGGTEIVFAVDTGAAMDWYTFGAEDALSEALVGIVEQAPSGCSFGVATKESIGALTDKDTAIEQLYDITSYTDTCDITALVDHAANLFSSNANKTLFIVTNQWEEIEEKVLLLEAQGVTVYVVVLESDEAMAEEIQSTYQNAVVCQNAKEMSYRLAGVYEEMANLVVLPSGGMRLMGTQQSSGSVTYNSSFHTGKHDFGFSVPANLSGGAALAALLNMYYLMPARASSQMYTYSINNDDDSITNHIVEMIGKGRTNGLLSSDEDYGLLTFWNKKAKDILSSPYYSKTLVLPTGEPENTELSEYTEEPNATEAPTNTVSVPNISIIEDNLRRRFPVMIAVGETNPQYYLITKLEHSGDVYTFTVYDPTAMCASNAELQTLTSTVLEDQYVKVIDTQKYFNTIYATHSLQASVTQYDRLTGKISFRVPTTYSKENIHTYPALEENAINVSNGEVSINVNRNDQFSVSIDTSWDSLLPNIHNSTFYCRILLFEDVENDHWAATDIFNMSNQGVINGRNDVSNTTEPSKFDPSGNATIAEYLAMVIRAADILNPQDTVDNNWNFPYDYINYVKTDVNRNHAIFLDQSVSTDAVTTEEVEEYYNNSMAEPIQRDFAFHITWTLLTSNACRTPTQLVEYQIDDPVSELPFLDLNTESPYNMSMAQLYKNGIINGFGDGTLRPTDSITRAQAAKILARCIQRFDTVNDATPINDGLIEKLLTRIPIGIPTSGRMGQHGNVAFSFQADQTGLYPISFSGNGLSLRVYEAVKDSAGNPHYYRCYPKAGKAGMQFPLQANHEVIVSLSGNPETDYTLCVGEAQPGSAEKPSKRTAYIVFYDSPIKRYLDPTPTADPSATPAPTADPSSTPTPPSVNDWNSYERYDVTGNEDFFTNYLSAFGNDVDPVFILSVRDVDFNTKRHDDADKVVYENGTIKYANQLDSLASIGDPNATSEPVKVNHARNDDLYTITVQGDDNKDLYSSTEEPALTSGEILTFAEYKELAVNSVAEEMVSIIEGFYVASQSTGISMPKFYIGTPHFRLRDDQLASVFAQKYYELAIGTPSDRGIYYEVFKRLHDDPNLDESCIEGIYNGCEDKVSLRSEQTGELSTGMQALCEISKFTHWNGLKFLWIPYGDMDEVGAIVNTGLCLDEEMELSYDLFDIVFTQPGTYFNDDFDVSIENNAQEHTIVLPQTDNAECVKALKKLYDIYHSVKGGVAVLNSKGLNDEQIGKPINGGKFTDTQFGVEIEYDMEFLTGRWDSGDRPSYSKQKAKNFLIVLDAMKSIIYDEGAIFATYSGGMNEQAYDLVGTDTENNNRHSLINYQTALGDRPGGPYDIRNKDAGNGKPYSWFFDGIKSIASGILDEVDKNIMLYNSDKYPKDLLFEITVGIMQNQWARELNDFLGMPEDMHESTSTQGLFNIDDNFYPMKYQNTGTYYSYPELE